MHIFKAFTNSKFILIQINYEKYSTISKRSYKKNKSNIPNENTSILEAANQFYKTYKNDGMIYIFGTGHSHMLAEEGHFRAGGFAPICPILFSGLMLHEGSLLSGEIERTAGIATRVLQNCKLKEKDTLMIFTNSGVNQAP